MLRALVRWNFPQTFFQVGRLGAELATCSLKFVALLYFYFFQKHDVEIKKWMMKIRIKVEFLWMHMINLVIGIADFDLLSAAVSFIEMLIAHLVIDLESMVHPPTYSRFIVFYILYFKCHISYNSFQKLKKATMKCFVYTFAQHFDII